MTRLPGLPFAHTDLAGLGPQTRRQRRSSFAAEASFASGFSLGGAPGGVQEVKDVGPGPTDQPIFELAFGFIPTLNIGNALGIDNDIARTIVNIVADPFAWLPAIFSGGATVAARASMAAARLGSSRRLFGAAKGATALAKLKNAEKTVRAATAAIHAPKELLNAAAGFAKAGDVKNFAKTMKKVLKTELPPGAKLGVDVTLNDLGNLKDLAKLELKLAKQFKNLPEAERLIKIDSILGPKFLKADRLSQLEAGQRSLLRIRRPFSSADGKTIIHGRALYKFLDVVKPLKLVTAAGATKLGATFDDVFQGTAFENSKTMAAASKATDDAIISWADEIEELVPGALGQGMDDLLKFHIEGKGVPVEELKRLGLLDEVLAAGGVAKKVTTAIRNKAGDITGRLTGIEVISQKAMDKFLKQKGWKDVMDSTSSHISKHLEDLRLSAVESGMVDDIPRLERYITHFWKVEKKQAKTEASILKRNGTMLNKRKFKTFVEGMNNKFTPEFKSTFEIVREYQREITEILGSRKLIDKLVNPRNKVWVNGQRVPFFANAKQIAKLDDAGVSTERLFVDLAKEGTEAREFLERIGRLNPRAGTRGTTSLTRTYVPRQVAQSLKVIYKSKNRGEIAQGVDKFNAVAKFASLSLSLFHAGALTETAMATLGPVKGFAAAARQGFGIPVVSQMLEKAGISRKISKELVDDGILHGIPRVTSSDAQRGVLDEAFTGWSETMDKVIPGLGKVPRFGKKFIDITNVALWDNLHEPLKFIGYEHWIKKLQKINPHLPLDEIKRTAAARMNDAFGGQNWALLGVNKQMQQYMHWALLAPDWTISNARVAGIGTVGLKGLARGILFQGRNPSEQIVGSYWRTAVPVMYGAMNLLNKSLTGKWMWENPVGNKLEVGLGTVDDEGRPEFMKLGKQMREPFRWLTDPLSIGGGKVSPLAKEVLEQLTGVSPGTGFKTAFAPDYLKKPQALIEQIPARVGNTLAKFIPYSISGKSVWFAFPKSSMTQRKVELALIDTLGRGKLSELARATGALNNRRTDIRSILVIAASSGMDVGRIIGNVKRQVGDTNGLLDSFRNQ